jgi:Dyp-type peroxidase family
MAVAAVTRPFAHAGEPLDLDDVQGLVVRGYGRLPHACYVLLRVADPDAARALVRRWADDVTPAAVSPRDHARHLAMTAGGVAALTGRPARDLGFAEPFCTGMATPYRSRLLGDVGTNAPDTWAWGGPSTPVVDVALLLYADTEDRLAQLGSVAAEEAAAGGFEVVTVLGTSELSDREHFGFHDGISQPRIAGLGAAGARGEDGGGDPVRAGEFVLGYVNEYDQRTERPLVPSAWDPARILPRDPDGSGAADVGRNGTYLVLRQLHQDVEAFEALLDAHATDPETGLDQREHLAAKIVGRWRESGAPLALAPEADDPALAKANDFGYHHEDPDGHGCPIGAHIRRANPRDALPPQPGTAASRAVNVRHRLLRRGRGYGAADSAEHGLHFVCLGTNLARQYEFVQHSWVNDPSFNGLVDTEDPLVGPRVEGPATFTVPADPVSRRVPGLPQLVRVRGGAYFFLPGLRALRYLSDEAHRFVAPTSTTGGSR